jgi:hypothetical protein
VILRRYSVNFLIGFKIIICTKNRSEELKILENGSATLLKIVNYKRKKSFPGKHLLQSIFLYETRNHFSHFASGKIFP